MIELKKLASMLEEKLNGTLGSDGQYANPSLYGLNSFEPNTNYVFKITPDTAEYKGAERVVNRGAYRAAPTNNVNVYINGILSVNGTPEIEGVTEDTYVTSMIASLELLVPNCNKEMILTDGSGTVIDEHYRLIDAVIKLLTSTLSVNLTESVVDENEKSYFVATRYSRPSVGNVEQRPRVGTSVPVFINVAYGIVAGGISSNDAVLEIEGKRIYYTEMALNRSLLEEDNIPSDSENASSKSTPQGSSFSISFYLPDRSSSLYLSYCRFLLTGEILPHTVAITLPGLEQVTYNMIFSTAAKNHAQNDVSSTQITMREVITINEVTDDG